MSVSAPSCTVRWIPPATPELTPSAAGTAAQKSAMLPVLAFHVSISVARLPASSDAWVARMESSVSASVTAADWRRVVEDAALNDAMVADMSASAGMILSSTAEVRAACHVVGARRSRGTASTGSPSRPMP